MIPTEVIILGDQPRTLKFTYRAITIAEELTGKSSYAIINDIAMLSMITIGKVLLAGLYHEDKKLKFSDVSDLLDKELENDPKVLLKIAKKLDIYAQSVGLFLQDQQDQEENNEVENPNQ